MTFSVKDEDHGLKIFLEAMLKSGARSVDVGILVSEGSQTKVGISGTSGKTVGEVAAMHEFGEGVPQRSFIRGWVDENKNVIKEVLATQAKNAFQNEEPNFDKAQERVGLWAQGQIQQRIADRIPPPNTPATIKKKGSDVPLIDTGQLRSSITYKVAK